MKLMCATIIYVIQDIYVGNKFIEKLLLNLKSYYWGNYIVLKVIN